ncbi:CAP domain-containing protein [Micromonospora sp. CA-263727]|uniref:CAP domain-containing protein n=1 Tax=Micromonospora sp. CA-263727 TaxID=3239967 RepID=UPI003D945937
MEATGVHGSNDPFDPEQTARRPEPQTDEPAWLTDRPAPRSSYLFGDEPEGASNGWYQDQPTEQWAVEPSSGYYEPTTGGWPVDGPATPAGQATDRTARQGVDWTARHAAPDTERYHAERHDTGHHDTANQWHGGPDDLRPGRYDVLDHGRPELTDRRRYDMTDHGRYDMPEQYGEPSLVRHGAAGTGGPDVAATRTSRPTSGRRSRRPLVLGGAAAAATLVVSIGVAALALPGDDTRADNTAGESIVASTPALAEEEQDVAVEAFDDPSPSPSLSPSPSTAAPSASPSRASRPTPAPSRSTATSPLSVERQGSPSRGTSASATPSTGATSEAAEVVALVNAERAKAGCDALSIDEKLMTAAQRHSQDQADTQNMSHTGSDGSDPGTRIDRVGYAWRTYGENVAWNQKTPAAVMEAWMNSPGHKANILNCAFTEIGVGVASSNGPYWTQVFAAPR